MVQLAEWTPRYQAAGVAVAAMSYDSLEVLDGFHSAQELPFPLLRDVNAEHMKAFNVLNEDYEPGHRGYGIPHPGVLLLGPNGRVLQKFAVPGYRERPPFEDMLAAVAALESPASAPTPPASE